DCRSAWPKYAAVVISVFCRVGIGAYFTHFLVSWFAEKALDKDSLVLCYQIRTVDKKRLIKKLGEVKNDDTRIEIIDALNFQLGL
ncbi:MAG: type II toxin-antitoxin system PemK/MazF family toxin, partial [Methylobacter sp.]|nr:type II toxin-antitoxin system PemK/MazF family toxin [Methylobacter sp.]